MSAVVGMTRRFCRVLFGICLSVAALKASALGQNGNAPFAESVGLEQIPNRLREADELVLNATGALLGVVENEMNAKRLSEPVGQAFREALCKIRPPIHVDVPSVLLRSLLPPNDEALVKSANDLDEAWEECKKRRAALMKQAVSEVARRTAELGQTAKSAAEITALLTSIDRVQESAQLRPDDGFRIHPGSRFDVCIEFLRELRGFLEFPLPETPFDLEMLLSRLQFTAKAAQAVAPGLDISERVSVIVQPIKTAAEEARTKLDDAILNQKPSAEILAFLTAFETASEHYRQVVPPVGLDASTEAIYLRQVYRLLADFTRAMEMRHWKQAQTQASEARKEIHGYTFAVNGGPEAHGPREITHWFGARRELAYEEFLSKLNRKATEGPKADEREQVEQLRKKLDRVAHPEDLAALANDLESERRNSEQSEAPYVFGLLAQQLASMAAGWSAMSPIVAVGEGGNEIDGASGAFSKELASLRDRIERDVTVHVLDAPELSQPPFLDQSLDDAIDKLRKRLAEKGEWRRALQILGMQSSGALPDHLRSKSTDVIHAIRAYLAGENFELAEEWADASSAYETVVRANLDHTPIKEAAKRLELLKTEHPEAVKASGKP